MNLVFEGVACPECNALCLPTEDELKDRWAYGVCFRCGTKLPPLRLTYSCYSELMDRKEREVLGVAEGS